MNKVQLITKLKQDIKNAQACLDNPRFDPDICPQVEGLYRGIITEAKRNMRRLQ